MLSMAMINEPGWIAAPSPAVSRPEDGPLLASSWCLLDVEAMRVLVCSVVDTFSVCVFSDICWKCTSKQSTGSVSSESVCVPCSSLDEDTNWE